jgi:hypothetical protein
MRFLIVACCLAVAAGCSNVESVASKQEVLGIWTGYINSPSFGSGQYAMELTEGGGYNGVLLSNDGMRFREDGTWSLENGRVNIYQGSHLKNSFGFKEEKLVSEDGKIRLTRAE